MTPRVSIVIPVYNVEAYIEECLLSVYNQETKVNIECIIVDDKGTDRSINIAESFIETNDNLPNICFRIIYRDENGGLSAARNTGIKAATGEYLYFLDSDDTIVPQCIETLVGIADKYGSIDLLPALYIRENNDMSQFGKDSFPEFSDNQRLIKRSLLDYDKIPVTAANRLIRRQVITEHNLYFKEGIVHEDNYWTFFLAKHIQRMAFCAEKLYYYRETTGSITKKPNKEKEALAFKTIIEDSCYNIDSFERGAQKRFILLHLLTARNSGYYNNASELASMQDLYLQRCSYVERIILYLIFTLKQDCWTYKKCVNLVQRLFLR